MSRMIYIPASIKPAEIAYTGGAGIIHTSGPWTFASFALGAAAAKRYVAVAIGVYGGSGETVTAVTIGGIAATIAHQVEHVGVTVSHSAIAIAAVPTGTTGDIVVTMSGAATGAACAVYRIVNLLSATATDTLSATGAPASSTIDVRRDGILLATSQQVNGGTTTWTGPTEDVDQDINTNEYHSSAVAAYRQAQTGITVQAASAGVPDSMSLAAVAWR